MLVTSGWGIDSPLPVHCSQSLCAASMDYVLVLKQAQVCLAVILPQSLSQGDNLQAFLRQRFPFLSAKDFN